MSGRVDSAQRVAHQSAAASVAMVICVAVVVVIGVTIVVIVVIVGGGDRGLIAVVIVAFSWVFRQLIIRFDALRGAGPQPIHL